jgi:hypothetical protein
MAPTLVEIAKSLNIAKSYVQNRPTQIFLCGGPIPDTGMPNASLRAVLMALIRSKYPHLSPSVILAEDAAKWYHNPDSPYFPNLVDLEKQIGALSTLILLIVESPGSIAELGAFSFIPSLQAKLYVVLEGSFQHKRSFIMDGPIAMVEKESTAKGGASRWYALNWLKKTKRPLINPARAEKAADKIIGKILDPAIKKTNKSELFRAENIEHQMLLVADLVSMSGSLLISEIMDMIEGLNLETEKKIEQKKVEEYLFLLENLGFLSKTRAGNYDFYVIPKRDLEFLSYISIDGKPAKRESLTLDIRATLKTLPNHDYRNLAFRTAARKKAK